MKLCKFVLTIFFMAHACGCVFMLIANLEKDDDGQCVSWLAHCAVECLLGDVTRFSARRFHIDSWPTRHGEDTSSRGRLYLVALYWYVQLQERARSCRLLHVVWSPAYVCFSAGHW